MEPGLLELIENLEFGAPADSFQEIGKLAADGFVVLRGVLQPAGLAALKAHFVRLRARGEFELDLEQVVGKRSCIHNEPISRLVQRLLVPMVTRAIGAAVKPSYSYLVEYHPGAELARHTDRPQCAWNLSLLISHEGGDPAEWPLCFDRGGRTGTARLAPGDAVIYSGTDVPHWREILPDGQSAIVLLGHYVPTTFAGSLD